MQNFSSIPLLSCGGPTAWAKHTERGSKRSPFPMQREKPAWFRDLFGFDESSTWGDNVNHFQMDGDTLVCRTAPQFPRQFVGRFECPSVAELRSKLAAAPGAAAPSAGLSFAHLAAPAGVGPLHYEPSNAGAVFQAASQFNCLEMTGPNVSPTAGVGIYINDRTQGPACALACPAATVYRNYLVQHEGNTGQHPVQIDNLKEVGVVVGNNGGRYWVMQNGYAMPVGRGSLAELAARLRTEPNLVEQAEAALRVGVHWETSVAPPLEHRVCQVYASALPCAYARGPPESDWEPFARLVLRAAYEATLAVGAVRSLEAGGARVKCYLTALGGGVFGNRYEWIRDAISHALDLYQGWPLDVVLVHYGSRVDANWAHDLAPREPVPTTLRLYGELELHTECLGTYLLKPQSYNVHGKPLWKHETEDRWIAWASFGKWAVQDREDLGGYQYCLSQDTPASLPHQSTAVWGEWDNTAIKWQEALSCKCFGDVPTSLSLCGELEHKTECLGTYLLGPQRIANGKPVWKHATADKWIAVGSDGNWFVQEGKDVDFKDAGFMRLEDTSASLPHQSTAVWEEWDGKEYAKAPSCKMENTSTSEKEAAAKRAADEKAAAEKAAAQEAAQRRRRPPSMLRRAMTWIGLPEAQKDWVEERAEWAKEKDGFALRPLLASDASVRRSLEALLETEHPGWLGKGKDVLKKYGPYDSLKLACAWKVDHPDNLDKYTAGVKRVQKEMDRLKKKGKDVDKVPGLPVKTTARAAEGFTMKAGANEAILLHGTIPDRLLGLLSTGLNERYSGTGAGTAFGDGVYLAEDVGKTDQYVSADSAYDPSSDLHKRLYGRTFRHPGDVFYVLVVRAALGYPVRTQQTGKKATSMDDLTPIFPKSFRELSPVPGVTPPIEHHSLIAELGKDIVRYREFVLFHSEYVHIDYVIAYHRCNGGEKLCTTTDNPYQA